MLPGVVGTVIRAEVQGAAARASHSSRGNPNSTLSYRSPAVSTAPRSVHELLGEGLPRGHGGVVVLDR